MCDGPVPVAQPWTATGHAALGRIGLDGVRELERLSARAWPPLETASLGGWVLRAAGGSTRRANSAWPRRAGTLSADQLLRATEAWYGLRGLAPVIQLSPANEPADLADHLARWTVGGETRVLVGEIGGAPHRAVTVHALPTDDWTAVAAVTAPAHFGPSTVGIALLQAISKPCGYAVLRVDGEAVAVGRTVVDGTQAGVFSMGTLPAHRGHGSGRAVLDALRH